MSGQNDDTDKPFEPTPQKLKKAREKGEIARSTDLLTAAGYIGLLLAFLIAGAGSITTLGTALMVMIDQSNEMSKLFFSGASAPAFGAIQSVATAITPIFALPALAVLGTLVVMRGIVFAPSKLEPKLSRISVISNAKNKFGRSGLFEFSKSFTKLIIYSVCLGFFINTWLGDMIIVMQAEPRIVVALLAKIGMAFLFAVVLISGAIGAIDALWQHHEHRRKNMMSRKEISDENKDAEGDPHMKQQRRQRAMEIANSQMMADVPTADVVIVNPTHFAVALKWSRLPGEAPACVAKGVDEIALKIREVAAGAAVPIHSDPPTARALHATTDIGSQIAVDHFRAVAAAIRFAESMRQRAKARQ
ncbi:MAG: flagellar type III secretion system protein FlhB [Sulfitobacter sp.]